MMGSKAFESPLIPHARMRALYRALVEVRALGKSRRAPQLPLAPLVAAIIDLHPGDLTSLPHSSWLDSHIRQTATREAPARSQIIRSLRARAAENSSSLSELDRLIQATGMALAVKPRQNVVVALTDSLTASHARHFFTVACEVELPLILVTSGDVHAPRSVPVIPVDSGDVIALYRVAQECIVRARADGNTAVMQCVPCGTDPIKLLATQLLQKKICTPRWIAGVEPALRKHLAVPKQP